LDSAVLVGADAVVALNGAGIGDARWTDDRKAILRSSRIDSVGLLASAIALMECPPGVFVSASATGFYGDTGDDLVDEGAPPGGDFLATLCVDWEAAARPAASSQTRVVRARTGIVLARNGGALEPLLPLFKVGLGGPIASGRQWWSWITLADEVSALLFLIDSDISGPVNLVAPNPVRQVDFAKALGVQLRRPAVIPVPRFALNLRLGKELAEAIGIASQRVSPRTLLDSGFQFGSSEIDEALASVLG
ncbi:MAG: TIGR01777 family oxidoreductase, partial [Actinomycetota bacterium]